MAERERRQRWHLGEQPDDLDLAHLLVMDLVGVRVEGRQRAHRGHEHAHGVGVVAEALHEVLHVLVHERVHGDLVHPLLQLRAGGQLAVDDQVGDLQEGGALAQLLDRIAPVLEDAGVAVDVRDRAAAGSRVHERRVVGHQAEVALVRLDLAQVQRAHGSVADRQLVRRAGAVVGDREGLLGGRAVALCGGALLLRGARLGLRRDRAARHVHLRAAEVEPDVLQAWKDVGIARRAEADDVEEHREALVVDAAVVVLEVHEVADVLRRAVVSF